MAKINVKDHAQEYRTQEERATFKLPPDGSYDVVNITMQRAEVGAKKSPKIHLRTAILAVVDLDDKSEDAKRRAEGWIGRKKDDKSGALKFTKTVGHDLWLTTDDKGQMLDGNVTRISCMAIAHGNTSDLDTDDDKSLVYCLTGVPYRIHFRSKVSGEYTNLEVISTKLLSEAERKKYSSDPDFATILGEPKDRVLAKQEPRTNGGGGRQRGGGSGGGQSTSDPFEDIPFSEGDPS